MTYVPDHYRLLILAKHIDGGTGTFIEQLVKLPNLSKARVTLMILALDKPQFRMIRFSRSIIKFFTSKKTSQYHYFLTPPAIAHHVRELFWVKKEISTFEPDVIITIDNHCNILGCLYLILFRNNNTIKLIATIHNNISAVTFAKLPRWSRRIFALLCRYLFIKADHIVCVSRGVAHDAKNFFKLKKLPKIIHYGIDIQKICMFSQKPMDKKNENQLFVGTHNIISIGRFVPQKDFVTLIKAFALFHKEISDAHLFLIGDGPEKKRLTLIVKQARIENNVHFLGWKQNIYPYIRASDIFVLSSHYEGFPYVLLEVAALGKPIIATDTPYGPRELLGNNKFGIVVPMKQKQELALAFKQMTDKNTYDYYRFQIRARINGFIEKDMIHRYRSLILSLMPRSS